MNSEKKFPTASLGTTVRVPIPDVDKGRGDSRNILAAIMSVAEDGFCRLGTSEGILKQLYARSQFILCPQNLLRIENIPDHELSLRSVAIAQSSRRGQGFVKCMCKTVSKYEMPLSKKLNKMSFKLTML
ncbi:uncharacterized protein TNCV_811121 [Trichonephila clavipes]|uniref:Uncharacterized protein n=1 Tax=Trichonephila clavipes TaxID=2585209 RepID=A0A8X6VIM5_TRICX|nr:uncharacterized protein TNCV_811121 [Trichonephila clavipes]